MFQELHTAISAQNAEHVIDGNVRANISKKKISNFFYLTFHDYNYICIDVLVYYSKRICQPQPGYISAVVLLSRWRRMTPELELGALVRAWIKYQAPQVGS